MVQDDQSASTRNIGRRTSGLSCATIVGNTSVGIHCLPLLAMLHGDAIQFAMGDLAHRVATDQARVSADVEVELTPTNYPWGKIPISKRD